jgi:hypothetical protein
MNDEWRLQVVPREPGHARMLTDRLEAHELEHDLSTAFHDRVIVSREDDTVFLYAGSREQAESARELIVNLAAKEKWELDLELTRWHPLAEEWEDPDKALPEDDAARRAEHEELMAAERKQAKASGHPEFEVRIDLPSRHDALQLAERLRAEGLLPVHRWQYVLIGAGDEDNAKALAKRIEAEAPPGSKVSAEGTWRAAYRELPPNPFAFLGGLGG